MYTIVKHLQQNETVLVYKIIMKTIRKEYNLLFVTK